MSAEIVSLKGQSLGAGARIEPDTVLTAQLGKLSEVVIIGRGLDGELVAASSCGVPDALYLVETAKRDLFLP